MKSVGANISPIPLGSVQLTFPIVPVNDSAAVLTAGSQVLGPATKPCTAPHPSVPVLMPAEIQLLGHVRHPRAASVGALLHAGRAVPRRQSWEGKSSLRAQQMPQIPAVY